MKKKRGLTIKINFSNRWLYTFIVLGILAVIGVGVYAYGTSSPSTFGHSLGEIAPPSPCTANQILQFAGTTWTCVDLPPTVIKNTVQIYQKVNAGCENYCSGSPSTCNVIGLNDFTTASSCLTSTCSTNQIPGYYRCGTTLSCQTYRTTPYNCSNTPLGYLVD